MDVCVFCQHFVDEDERVEVEGDEVAHRECAAEWCEEDED